MIVGAENHFTGVWCQLTSALHLIDCNADQRKQYTCVKSKMCQNK